MFAFFMPKASEVSPKAFSRPIQESPPSEPGRYARRYPSRHRRACADCFRSQLRRIGFGLPRQARPRHGGSNITRVVAATAQNRNFLLCWKAELSTLP